jgi:hypothetical protein
MEPSLQEICYKNIANTMLTAPPMLQEIVAGETKKRMEERLQKDVKESVEEETYKQVIDYMPDIVPEIMQDMIRVMTVTNGAHKDYYFEYPKTPRYIVTSAIRIAEEAVRVLDERYVYPAFNQANMLDTNDEDEEDSDEDSDFY